MQNIAISAHVNAVFTDTSAIFDAPKRALPTIYAAIPDRHCPRRQRRVTLRAHDRAMAQEALNRAGVVPIVGELGAARMTKHVGMDEEGEARSLAGSGDHLHD